MVSKLVFKGEKPVKKRTSKGGINKSSSLESTLKRKSRGDSVKDTVDVEDGTWTCARSVNQLTGPIVLVGVSLNDLISY